MARTVLSSAYWKLGSWPVVAFWWLNGKVERSRSTWSAGSRRYVDKVMAGYAYLTGRAVVPVSPTRTFQETRPEIAYKGAWAAAQHRAYSRSQVYWSASPGSTATLTFTGSSVTLVGPRGPTRGVVRVLVDGVEARVIDLWAPRFVARNRLFAVPFGASGQHTITLEVLQGPGRYVVALDAFTVWP
jgi:hypothetical protein